MDDDKIIKFLKQKKLHIVNSLYSLNDAECCNCAQCGLNESKITNLKKKRIIKQKQNFKSKVSSPIAVNEI